MNKEPTFASRIKQYSSIAAVIAAASPANAQIVYTDVNPDIVIGPNQEFQLDMNNDGNFEYIFAVNTYGMDSNGQLKFHMYAVNEFDYDGSRLLVYGGNQGGQLRHLDYGYVLNGSAEKWDNYGLIAANGYGQTSYPWNNTEKYVGAKFHFDTQAGDHFGWIRIAVNTDNPDNLSIVIKDFAYNVTAGQKIMAGEGGITGCSDSYEPNNNFSQATPINVDQPILSMINPSQDKDFYKFSINGNQPNIRVVLYNLPKNYDIKLFDGSKQLLETAKNKKKENDTIIYNNAVAGTYYVKVYQKDNAFDASNCYSLIAETSPSPFKISSLQQGDLTAVNLFPNPASELLSVQFDDQLQADAAVFIFDLEGKQVMQTIVSAGEAVFQLNVSSLNQGMYLLKAIAGNEVMMKKFSVVR